MKWPAHPCHFCETMWKNRLSISICFCITTLQLVKWKQKLSVIDFENTLYETPGFFCLPLQYTLRAVVNFVSLETGL